MAMMETAGRGSSDGGGDGSRDSYGEGSGGHNGFGGDSGTMTMVLVVVAE